MKNFLMTLTIIVLSAAFGVSAEAKNKSNHNISGNLQFQFRTNSNVGVAPSSTGAFNFDDEDFDDEFDDFDEDELEEFDAVDEDGDSLDDLLDSNADSTTDSDNRFSSKLTATHKYKVKGSNLSWKTGFKALGDMNQERDDLDKTNLAFTTGPVFLIKEYKLKIKPSISYVTLRKDHERFLDTVVGSLGLEYKATKKLLLSAIYNYQDRDITTPTSPDATVDTLKFGAKYKLTKKDILGFAFSPKFEDSSQTTRDKDNYGAEFTYSRKLPYKMVLDLGVKYNSVDYKNLSPNRNDDIYTYGAYISKKLNKTIFVSLGYENKDRRSNIAGKDATNNSLIATIGWKF